MSCRRVCRELLALVRFGELGPRSQPHLEHLAGCAACRDEVGYDREMVRLLRAALAARVEGIGPSPSVWQEILRRAQAPEPGPLGWFARLGAAAVHRRTATAMAGTALALVLALNMEVVSVVPVPSPSLDAVEATGPSSVSAHRWARPATAVERAAEGAEPVAGAPATAQTEIRMTGLVAGLVPPSVAAAPEPAPEVRVVFRTQASPEPLADDDRLGAIASQPASEPAPEADPHPPPVPEEGHPS